MKEIIDVAHENGAGAVAHGATGKGNDQVRFDFTVFSLASSLKIIAPWRDAKFRRLIPGRKEAIAYAREHNIPVVATQDKPWSSDPNIGHISHEAGVLEDPWKSAPDDLFEMIRPSWLAGPCPDHRASYETVIHFEKGLPVAVNCMQQDSIMLLKILNALGAARGIGIVDMVEDRYLGMKSRGVYEAPGMTLLYAAHMALARLCLDKEDIHDMLHAAIDYGRLVYEGKWFSDRKKNFDVRVDAWNENITGNVRLHIYCGGFRIAGCNSPHSLYSEETATMEGGGDFNQSDATGFINISGLSLKAQAKRKLKKENP